MNHRDDVGADSFRDPSGFLSRIEGRIIRFIDKEAAAGMTSFLESRTARSIMDEGHLVKTTILDKSEKENLTDNPDIAIALEHEKIPFPSYPFEWPAEMLYASGRLTLDLAQRGLEEGLGLKDATPYNVLFRGPKPVFIDLPSFERRKPGDPIWQPYAQFVRTFLLPLLVNKHFGIGMGQIFLNQRDGLEPDQVYSLCSPLRRLLPPFLGLVSMPTWLASRAERKGDRIYRRKILDQPEKADFILRSLLKQLSRKLERLAPDVRKSHWAGYMDSKNYDGDQFAQKERFLNEILAKFKPARVLDLGCNTGHFSAMAAKNGASVVALDYDPVGAGRTWRRAVTEGLDILPLAVDITRPSPAIGWRNRECPSFLDRIQGRFEAVLMLALIHHLMVTERIPLDEIVDLASRLTTEILVVEYIDPSDVMFHRLTRGRDDLFADLDAAAFEKAFRRRFKLERPLEIPNSNRRLYLMRK